MCVDRHRRTYRGVACEIGHEFAGEIVEAEDSALIVRGAAVFPILPCGTCEACRMEHYAQCSYDYYGSRSDGAMAEYIAVKQENFRLMPEGVSYEEAAMVEHEIIQLLKEYWYDEPKNVREWSDKLRSAIK